GEGVPGKLHPALLVSLLEGPVHECLGLAERRVLVRLALRSGDKLLRHAPHRPAVGELVRRRLRSPSLRASATRFSLLPGPRKSPPAPSAPRLSPPSTTARSTASPAPDAGGQAADACVR